MSRCQHWLHFLFFLQCLQVANAVFKINFFCWSHFGSTEKSQRPCREPICPVPSLPQCERLPLPARLSQLRNRRQSTVSDGPPDITRTSPVLLCPCSLLEDLSFQGPHCLWSSHLPSFPWSGTAPRLSLLLMTLGSWGGLAGSRGMPLVCVCQMFLSWLQWGLRF